MMLFGICESIYCVKDCKRNTIYCVFRQHPRRPAVPHHEADVIRNAGFTGVLRQFEPRNLNHLNHI